MDLFSLQQVCFSNLLTYPTLSIQEGVVTVLCGKSGSGKSTLLKLLNATASPSAGTILYRNQPLDAYDAITLRREVLLVPQAVYLFDDTIQNNFLEFYRYREQSAPDEETMARFLSLCLADFPLGANCRNLSGGERQRVFLAICLSLAPRVLMLDEPTSALDGATASALMEGLTHHCRSTHTTLLAITHDTALAQQYGDVVVSLDGGADHG